MTDHVGELAEMAGCDLDVGKLLAKAESADPATARFVVAAGLLAAARRHNAPDDDPRLVDLRRRLPALAAPLIKSGVLVTRPGAAVLPHLKPNERNRTPVSTVPPTAPGYPQPPAQPPRKGMSTTMKVLIGVAAVFVAVCLIGVVAAAIGGGGKKTADDPKTAATTTAPAAPPAATKPPAATTKAAPPPPADNSITYEVTGEGRASVTWIDGNFQSSQETDAALPWTRNVGKEGIGMNFSAQRKSGDGGTIGCRILRGSKEISKNQSTGPYAIVQCTIH